MEGESLSRWLTDRVSHLLIDRPLTERFLDEGLGDERFDHAGEQTDGDVAAHPGFGPVPDRAQMQEVLEHPK